MNIPLLVVKEQHVLVANTRGLPDTEAEVHTHSLTRQKLKPPSLVKVGKLFARKDLQLLEALVDTQHPQQLPGGSGLLCPAVERDLRGGGE